MADHAHSGPDLPQIAGADAGSEHRDRPGGRVTLGAEQAQERRLAGPVGPEHGPMLVAADRERQGPEQPPPVGDHDGRAVEPRRRLQSGRGDGFG